MAHIQGTNGDDDLEGTEFDDEIEGLGGTDTIDGNDGDDLIDSGPGGHENEEGDRVFETVNGGAGNDTVLLTWNLQQDPAFHDLDGGTGVDTLDFDASAMDYVDWTLDEDGEGGTAAHLTLYRLRFDGFERLAFRGTAEADRVTGFSGNDTLYGNGGDDELRGGTGNDYLDGGAGDDEMFGDAGNDVMIVDQRGEGAFGGAGIDTVRSSASHSLRTETENLTLTGTAVINGAGNELNNVLLGNDRANVLSGKDGNDYLDGRGGADLMRGGNGNDRYVVTNKDDQAQESSAAGGTDTVSSSVSFTLGQHVENLILIGTAGIGGQGNALANAITGNNGANFLKGYAGADILKGGIGADRIEGGTGADRIYGGSGNDVLRGGDGAADHGADRFYFDTRPNTTSNHDKIEDFSPADDAVYLAKAVFTGLGAPGTLAPTAFRNGTAAGDSSDRIIYHKASGNIFYDVDGAGGEDQILFATVTPGLTLTNADFVVYI